MVSNSVLWIDRECRIKRWQRFQGLFLHQIKIPNRTVDSRMPIRFRETLKHLQRGRIFLSVQKIIPTLNLKIDQPGFGLAVIWLKFQNRLKRPPRAIEILRMFVGIREAQAKVNVRRGLAQGPVQAA